MGYFEGSLKTGVCFSNESVPKDLTTNTLLIKSVNIAEMSVSIFREDQQYLVSNRA